MTNLGDQAANGNNPAAAMAQLRAAYANIAEGLDTALLQKLYANPETEPKALVREVCGETLKARGESLPMLKDQLEVMFDRHRAAGLAPIAVHGPDTGHANAGKAPRRTGWQQYDGAAERALLRDGDSIGWLCGTRCDDTSIFVGLDLDFDDDEAVEAARQAKMFSGQPVRLGRPGRALIPLRMLASARSQDLKWVRRDRATGKLQIVKLQIIAAGRQFVASGIHPGTRKDYRWEGNFDPVSQWPALDEAAVLGEIDEALKPLGYARSATKAKAELTPDQCKLPDDMTAEEKAIISHLAAADFGHMLNALQGRSKGDGRSLVALAGCSTAGPMCWAGLADEAVLRARIEEVQPGLADEDNCIDRGFASGNDKLLQMLKRLRGEGGGCATFGCSEGADGDESEDLKTAEELAREMWETKRRTVHVISSEDQPRMTATHAAVAFTRANSKMLFRSTANGQIVTIEVKGAPDDVAEAADAANLDAFARPPAQYPQELPASDTKLKAINRESVVIWDTIEFPANVDLGAGPGIVPQGVEEVAWQFTIEKRGKEPETVTIKARTVAWMAKYASNPQVLLKLDPSRTVFRQGGLDKLHSDLAFEIIQDGTNGANLWRLTGVHCAPQFTEDRRVVTTDGFHGDNSGRGFFLALGDLNGRVSADMPLEEAKVEVRKFLALFPYSGPEDEAVLCSLFYTSLSRRAFPLAPGHLMDAPRPGTGKTLAAVIIAKIAGSVAPRIIVCTDNSRNAEEEVRKRVEQALIVGASGIIVLDDLPGSKVPNISTLRTAMSEPNPLAIRKMGKNDESADVMTDPTRVTWVFTGNNLVVHDDLVRRCISGYLDRLEAEKRGWEKGHAYAELQATVAEPERRAKLLSAALTVISHNWRERPNPVTDTENYERWSRVVREAVIYTTGSDPWATNSRLGAEDARAEEHAEVCAALLEITEGQKVELRQIVDMINSSGPSFQNPTAVTSESVKTIRRIFPSKGSDSGELFARLGSFLRRHKNKPTYDDVKLVIRGAKPEVKSKKSKAVWWIEVLDKAKTEAAAGAVTGASVGAPSWLPAGGKPSWLSAAAPVDQPSAAPDVFSAFPWATKEAGPSNAAG